MTTTTISDLPDLPMTKIFSYLPMVDRLRAEFVCRRWNRLAKDKDSWRHFHALRNQELRELLNKKRSIKLQIKRLISRFGEFVNELEFELLGYTTTNHPECLYLDLLPLIVQQIGGHRIHHLKIEFWKPRGHNNDFENKNYLVMIQIANKMPELRTLLIDGKIEYFDLEWLKMFGDHCTKLELLHLYSLPEEFAPYLARFGFVFPASLKNIKLDIERRHHFARHIQPRINDNQIYLSKIAQECPNLVSLDADYSNSDNFMAIELATRVHHLTSKVILNLAIASRRHQRFENIQALEFWSLNSKEFIMIGQKCPKLEHLSVYKLKTSDPERDWANEEDLVIGEKFASEILEKFDELGAAFINLKSLKLSNKNSIRFLLPLITNGNFNQLEWLNLPRDYIQMNEDVIALMENCPKLAYLTAYSIKIEAICEILRRRKDYQLSQLRMKRPIWDRDLAQICDVLVNFYEENEIPDDLDNPGIVRICCYNGPSTPQWTFDDDLHPWLRIYDNYKKPFPSALALKQARFGGLSEIPLFLDSNVGN